MYSVPKLRQAHPAADFLSCILKHVMVVQWSCRSNGRRHRHGFQQGGKHAERMPAVVQSISSTGLPHVKSKCSIKGFREGCCSLDKQKMQSNHGGKVAAACMPSMHVGPALLLGTRLCSPKISQACRSADRGEPSARAAVKIEVILH